MTEQQHAAKCSSSNKKYQPVPVDAAKTIAEKYNKSIVITPQETWKERFNQTFPQIFRKNPEISQKLHGSGLFFDIDIKSEVADFIANELAAARADEAERCALHEEAAKEEGRKEERERIRKWASREICGDERNLLIYAVALDDLINFLDNPPNEI